MCAYIRARWFTADKNMPCQWKTCVHTANVRERHTHHKPKKYRRMATLKELCSSVPQSLLREQAIYNVNQRKQAAYNKRMERLGMERAIFEQCKHTRTQKRVKNKFSTEQAGTCSQSTTTRRFATSQTFVEKRGTSVRTYTLTSYTNVVCKSYSNKY